nr:LysR family substrate-binding domain-containing protein [Rhizobium sp. ICMP 5592]
MRAFRTRYPEIVIELAEMNSPTLERALSAGDIDLGILHPPITAPELAIRTRPSQRLKLALPASHRLADRETVTVLDLDGEPFLIAPRIVGPSIYDRVIALFRSHGISPRIVQEVTPMTTLTGLVAAGVGMGFVTDGIATVARPGVVFRPVLPEPPDLPIAAAWRLPDLSSPAARFLDIVAVHTSQSSRPATR